MRNRSKLLFAALGAIALLGMAVSAASAGRLELTNSERGFRITWSSLRLESSGREANCPVTLEGTFAARTYAKRAGTTVGSVTEAVVGTCTRNRATVLRATLPWSVTYNSFAGTLPNIREVKLNLIGAAFNVNLEGIECLARTTSTRPARGNALVSAGEIRTFEAESGAGIETSGGFFCQFAEAHFSGNGTATTREGTATTRIRLI